MVENSALQYIYSGHIKAVSTTDQNSSEEIGSRLREFNIAHECSEVMLDPDGADNLNLEQVDYASEWIEEFDHVAFQIAHEFKGLPY